MSNNFKVGDKVRRIHSNCDGLVKGRLYQVSEVRPHDVLKVEGHPYEYIATRFELVSRTGDAKPLLPHDSLERKQLPIFSVLFGYFPAAMVKLTQHCFVSNEKHNPGEDLHWSRGKSDDHKDAAMRHLIEGDHVGLLWRAAALLQLQLEAEGAEKAPLAR